MLALALMLEAILGYPDWLFRAIGHPVAWMGKLLAALDAALDRTDWTRGMRQLAGVLTLCALLGAAGLAAGLMSYGLGRAAGDGWAATLLLALAASSLLAQRSLHCHVRAVATALDGGGLPAGRTAVGMIVGRDTAALDEAGVCRAAIESLAENFSDGVVAPAFWIAVAGLPGGVLYKAANTADSMIGHRTPRYAAFGWAAARFDDLVNLPASRLAALWLTLAAALLPGASARAAMRAIWRDARQHRSPNAGWPEAAMAGALGFALAGPRVYGGALADDVFMGDGRRDLSRVDFVRALSLYRVACGVQFAAVLALAFAFGLSAPA